MMPAHKPPLSNCEHSSSIFFSLSLLCRLLTPLLDRICVYALLGACFIFSKKLVLPSRVGTLMFIFAHVLHSGRSSFLPSSRTFFYFICTNQTNSMHECSAGFYGSSDVLSS